MVLLLVTALLAAGVTACSPPPHETSLDEIIARELGVHSKQPYEYRCTAGAHRGASVEHRENTLTALRAADEDDRYAFIEFDVQYSGDGRIVVFHDNRLLRLFGSLRAVGESTSAELAELTGGEIAAYDEVMDSLDKKVNIEIKSRGDAREDRRLADEIIADIRSRGREGDVMLSSISGEVIRYISDTSPGIATGLVFWLTSSTYLHWDSLTRRLYEDLHAARADYLLLHTANLRNIEDLLRLKPRNAAIVFWDFDDSMYLVHKDIGDRLWGHSRVREFFRHLRHVLSPLYGGEDGRPGPANPRKPEITA